MTRLKYKVLILLFFTFSNSCKYHYYSLNMIYNDIYVNQISSFPDSKIAINTMKHYRDHSNIIQKLRHLDSNDTIFILEYPSIETGYMSTSWNKKDTISFASYNVNNSNQSLFTNYMLDLVSEWDIYEIKKEGEINSEFISPEFIYATRIILQKKIFRIDCIRFKDFFDLERDKYDFTF